MLTQNYLNLRLVRLKADERWKKEGEGLTFLFPRAGAGNCLKGASKQPLSAGDVLLVNGDPTLRIQAASSGEFAFSGFSLRLDHLFPLFASTEISLLQTVIEEFKGYKFYPASSGLAGECHKLITDIPPQFNLDHRGQLLRLASAILTEEFKTAHAKRVGFIRPEDHLIQVFERLSVDEMLSLTVPDLAKRFGCSRRHLNRLFHHYLGYSVAALRMEMRLMKAVSLLRDCDAKVINVAEQCGFNHLGLFNTCFRKRFGTSPGQWRKSMAQKPAEGRRGRSDDQCPLRTTGLCPWPSYEPNKAQPPAKPNRFQTQRPERRDRSSKLCPAKKDCPVDFALAVAAGQPPAPSLAIQVRAQP